MIHVEGIGKRYKLGATIRHDTLRDWIMHRVRGAGEDSDRDADEFWALRDVSFEVPEGDVIGIIGKNGAGKSTLLKILSRITQPTEGRVRLAGRVASLLEVGTGFHPELSGRENIFLNGAILGMTRHEIRAKFDEIVAFAEVERFLDTPVKRYSSGMYVRLAFAVAAHLEPEILLVDEVLAVGDNEFQKKCLGKMNEVAKGGRTVLFVSHNMSAVEELCTRAILLTAGSKTAEGSTKEIIRRYLDDSASGGTIDLSSRDTSRMGEGKIRVTRVSTSLADGTLSTVFPLHEPMRITLSLEGPPEQIFHLGIGLSDLLGNQIVHQSTLNQHTCFELDESGRAVVCLEIENVLNAGDYYLTYWVGDRHENTQDYARNCLKLVSDTTRDGQSRVKGCVVLRGQWSSGSPDVAASGNVRT